MRFLMLAALLFCSALIRGEEHGYAIIDAIEITKKQAGPMWIALVHRGKYLHVPVGQVLVQLKPGKYSVHHFDFGARSGAGNHAVFARRNMGFSVEPDMITTVGFFYVGKYKGLVRVVGDEQTLFPACKVNPDLVSRLPVNLTMKNGSNRVLKVKCESQPAAAPAQP